MAERWYTQEQHVGSIGYAAGPEPPQLQLDDARHVGPVRTFISELFEARVLHERWYGPGHWKLLLHDRGHAEDGRLPAQSVRNVWGRKFYKSCGDLPGSVQAQCGDGKAFQVNDQGWLVWVGDGNSWRDGITKNLWQTKLPAAQSPWNVPIQFGMPIIDRPLAGTSCSAISPLACPGEGFGALHILGSALPDFRLTWNNTIQFKRLTAYVLVDGTYGHYINNQGEQWGLLDFSRATSTRLIQMVGEADRIWLARWSA